MKHNKIQQFFIQLLFLSLVFSNISANETDELNEKIIGSDYLNLYTKMKFNEMTSKYCTQDTVFEDPTTSFFSRDKKYEKVKGVDEMIKFLNKGFKDISHINYEIINSYTVGIIHFTYGIFNYDALMQVNGKNQLMSFSLPLSIVLTIKDGKVIHHLDIGDYVTWAKQYKSQLENKLE